MVKKLLFFGLLFELGALDYVQAQTCCSGGVPVAANLGLPAGEQGNWQFALSYDINSLNTLKHGNEILDDKLRQRLTQSILVNSSYTFSQRLAFELLLTYVRQERRLFTPFGTNNTATNGIGDGVLLITYNVLPSSSKTSLRVGLGPKIPFGAADKTLDNGVLLPADLQPGSGAWDLMLWGSGSQSLGLRKSMSVFLTSTYRETGVNADYLGSSSYEFGNVFQSLIGLNDQFVLGSAILNPSLMMRYRRAWRDKSNDREIDATGGEWVFISTGINYLINADFAINAIVELPVYSYVNNTQLTTSYRLNIGLLLSL